MADLKSKAKTTINDAASTARSTINAAASSAKRTTDKVIDRSREAAHAAGKTMVKQGKKLQSL